MVQSRGAFAGSSEARTQDGTRAVVGSPAVASPLALGEGTSMVRYSPDATFARDLGLRGGAGRQAAWCPPITATRADRRVSRKILAAMSSGRERDGVEPLYNQQKHLLV